MIENETFLVKPRKGEFWSPAAPGFISSRASNFGDGLFETMIAIKGKIRFYDRHLERLMEGMALLDLDSSYIDEEELRLLVANKVSESPVRIRWDVFRAGAGKYTPESNAVVQQLHLSPHTPTPSVKNKTGIAESLRLYPTAWSACKTLNAIPYVLANKERKERGLDEIILLDHRGFISEAGAANIFWRIKDRFFTPSLSCACINGVSRRVIKEELLRKNISLQEGEFTLTEMLCADQVLVTNCTGISYLSEINGRKFEISPVPELERLFQIF